MRFHRTRIFTDPDALNLSPAFPCSPLLPADLYMVLRTQHADGPIRAQPRRKVQPAHISKRTSSDDNAAINIIYFKQNQADYKNKRNFNHSEFLYLL